MILEPRDVCPQLTNWLLFVALWCVGTSARADAPKVTVLFPKMGQMCLSSVEEKQLNDALKQLAIPADAAISLVAYSDNTEMRAEGWREDVSCIQSHLPFFIVDHGRIAVYRALAFLEIAARARPDVFKRELAIHLGSEESAAEDPRVISIVPKRGDGTSPADRRVEMRWSLKPTSAGKYSAAPPVWMLNLPLRLNAVTSTPLERAAPNKDRSWIRSVGIVGLTMGLAGLGAGIGLLVRSDQLDYSASIVPSGALAGTYEGQSHNLFLGGVISTALGGGLTALGLAFLLLPRLAPDKVLPSSAVRAVVRTLRASHDGVAFDF